MKGFPADRGYHVGLTSLAAYLNKHGIETAVITGDLLIDDQSSNNLITAFIPIWFRYDVKEVAARQSRYAASLNDDSLFVWKKFKEIVRETKPLMIGISYLTPMKYSVEKIASLAKEVNKDIKVVVGAYHPTFCAEEVLQNPDIDFAIRGEGEIPILDLIKEIKTGSPKLEKVPNLCYKDKDGQVRSNPSTGPISNLDELPYPARELVWECDYDRYRVHCVSTARGCPYTCSFCSDRRFWGGKVRRRSVPNVIQEIKQMKDRYRIDYIDIIDGTFTYDKQYLHEFCNALINDNIKINWRCTARYDNLDKEMLTLMKKAHCTAMYFGLESGSGRMLEVMEKRETLDKVIETSKMVYDSGIMSITSVLLGLPDENKQDIEDTIKVMREFKTNFYDVNVWVPIPGSKFYDSLSKEELAKVDWRRMGYKSLEHHFSRTMTKDEFDAYRDEAYNISRSTLRKTLVRAALRLPANLAARVTKRN